MYTKKSVFILSWYLFWFELWLHSCLKMAQWRPNNCYFLVLHTLNFKFRVCIKLKIQITFYRWMFWLQFGWLGFISDGWANHPSNNIYPHSSVPERSGPINPTSYEKKQATEPCIPPNDFNHFFKREKKFLHCLGK